jgi:Zn-dependent metalloprotease
MRNKFRGGGSGGSASWEIVFAILLVLIGAVAFAGQGHEKRVIIHGKHEDKRAIENLADDSEGDVEIDTGPKTIINIKGRFRLDLSKPVEDEAVDFIDRHRDAFGLKNPQEELKLYRKEVDKWGLTDIFYQQTYNGVPIWSSGVSVLLNRSKEVYEIDSGNVPTPDIDTTPLITKEEAIKIATADKVAEAGGEVIEPGAALYIYNNKLAYEIFFLYKAHGWRYFIDAKNGRILYKYDRTSYDGAVNATGTYTGSGVPLNAEGMQKSGNIIF